MSDKTKNGNQKGRIYLIVDFNWPEQFTKEMAQNAAKLHQLTSDEATTWISETVAASGGVGGKQGSVWIFQLENYAALDKLFHDSEDEISQTYNTFFSSMVDVEDKIRDRVIFS